MSQTDHNSAVLCIFVILFDICSSDHQFYQLLSLAHQGNYLEGQTAQERLIGPEQAQCLLDHPNHL